MSKDILVDEQTYKLPVYMRIFGLLGGFLVMLFAILLGMFYGSSALIPLFLQGNYAFLTLAVLFYLPLSMIVLIGGLIIRNVLVTRLTLSHELIIYQTWNYKAITAWDNVDELAYRRVGVSIVRCFVLRRAITADIIFPRFYAKAETVSLIPLSVFDVDVTAYQSRLLL